MPYTKREVRKGEIDIYEFISILLRYKWLLLFFTIIGIAVAWTLIFFTTPMYKANAVIKINKKGSSNLQNLVLKNLGVTSSSSVEFEKEMITSRKVIEQTLDKVNLTNRFYIIKNFKTVELYGKQVPFDVTIYKGKNIFFHIKPIDYEMFKLEIKMKNFVFSKLCHYGERIKTEYFDIVIFKKNPFDTNAEYVFVQFDKSYMAEKIKSSFLQVSTSLTDDSVLRVSFVDNVPKRAALFVNTLIDIYIKEIIKQQTYQAERTLKFINKQLKTIEKKLAKSELKLENYKKNNKIVDLQYKTRRISSELELVERKINDLTTKESAINFISHQIDNKKNLKLISPGLVNDSILNNLIIKLQQMILKKEQLLLTFTSLHPDVIAVNEQISILTNMIKHRVVSIKNAIKKQKNKLFSIKEKYMKIFKKLPTNERKLTDLYRTYKVNEKMYSYLLEKKAATELLKASIVSNNKIIDKAVVPSHYYKPKKLFMIVSGGFIGFALGLIIVLIKEFLYASVINEKELEKITNFPVLGSIPHIKKNGTILRTLEYPESYVSEMFRKVEFNLQHFFRDAKVIAIVSSVNKEGRATVISNLAGSFANSKKRTLLIDMNLRKPKIHKIFDLPNKYGIANVLNREIKLSQSLQRGYYRYLDIISAGVVNDINPGELLQSDLLPKVLDKLKNAYDIILINTPPLTLVIDGFIIMEYSDANIYLFRANYSKKSFINILNDTKIKNSNLAILLNDVSIKKFTKQIKNYDMYIDG